jgi:hypothetical protein
MNKQWPIVLENDDGIRQAGPKDECFYCGRKIGHEHKRDCVVVHKKVLLRYTIEIPLEFPHFWTKEQIEFDRNEGSWCASNIIGELEQVSEFSGCLCGNVKAEFVRVIDDTPNRAVTTA